MCRALATLVCCFGFTASAVAQPIVFPDLTTSDQPGGLMIIRKGNQTTWSLGGVILPRFVKVVTRTLEGKEITRFKMPSVFRDPYQPPLPSAAPASLQVEVPDPHALLFIEGDLVRTKGKSRQLESPILPPGKAYPLHVRAAFVVGEDFLIEDKQVALRAGESTTVTFDGTRALRVPLQKVNDEK